MPITDRHTDRVLDSSDVVIHVLDARDPLGTRCHAVEKFLREEKQHKHLIYVLNSTLPSSSSLCRACPLSFSQALS